ncbi:ribokinase [Hyphobacterium sp.]|uniref:ribokinase n=1 Tax=Hyphobacterium sp. TaxID=2004662 RepID=UPI003BAAC719
MTTPLITVVGSVNLDLIAECPHLPAPGETVLGGAFHTAPGGKGANQALAARRLGADVDLIACVGNDDHAAQALELLKAAGVALEQCRTRPGHATGVALINVSETGDNQIVVAPGANTVLSPSDIPEIIDGALIGQLETPVLALEAALKICDGLKVVNLAPAMPLDDAFLKLADILVVNEVEAEFYGLERLNRLGNSVVLTLGAKGAVMFREGKEVARAAPPIVDAIDTVGAGDTFVGALTVGFLEGKSDEEALAFACVAGALATTKQGAQPAIPDRAEINLKAEL